MKLLILVEGGGGGEKINDRRQVKGKLSHFVEFDVCRLPFAVCRNRVSKSLCWEPHTTFRT